MLNSQKVRVRIWKSYRIYRSSGTGNPPEHTEGVILFDPAEHKLGTMQDLLRNITNGGDTRTWLYIS